MASKRVHILSAVNAAQVSKDGNRYRVKAVCGAVDGIVMNSMLYPGDQLKAGAPTLEGRPAPAGHPKNAAGQYISANSGEAMLEAYMGCVCMGARHEGGRTLTDVVINADLAGGHEAGKRLIKRLDAAINGENAEPIHVSTGLVCDVVEASGESNGKSYSRIATNIRYDHLAILLDEQGAGTPEQGVGMFLNAAGQPEQVEAVTLELNAQDKRHDGLVERLKARIGRLLGNEELSFDAIESGIYQSLPEGAWLREVYARHCIWTDKDGKHWQQDYSVSSSDGSVSLQGQAEEVVRKVEYQPISTNQEKDQVKDKIVAALNAAGIPIEGKDDSALLVAYNALVSEGASKPLREQLDAANAKVQTFEANARKAEDEKRDTLVAKLATNSQLTADELRLLPVATLEKLAANAQGAAPVIVGNADKQQQASEFAGYSLNAHTEVK